MLDALGPRLMRFFTAEAGVSLRSIVIAGSALSLAAVVVWRRAYLLDVETVRWNIATPTYVVLFLVIPATHIGIGIWTTWLWTRGRGLPVWAFAAWILVTLVTVPIHLFSYIGSELAGQWKVRGPY